MVELVGIELLRILKTGKLLICRESYNAHHAYETFDEISFCGWLALADEVMLILLPDTG